MLKFKDKAKNESIELIKYIDSFNTPVNKELKEG